MDVYKFINSKDIRSHCEKTGHKFNPLEIAFLIYQSDHHTIVEKHAAWNELICTMPDVVIERRANCEYHDSLHKFLRKYMTLENKLLEDFFANKDGCVYRFDKIVLPHYYGVEADDIDFDIPSETGKNLYSNFAAGLAIENRDNEEHTNEIVYYKVIKYYVLSDINQAPSGMTILVDSKGAPLKIEEVLHRTFLTKAEKELLYMSFDGMWINVPTPFKEGDIVFVHCYLHGYGGEPFVLTSLCTDAKDELGERRIRRLQKNGDISDMTAFGYRIHRKTGCIRYEYDHDYLSLEYYEKPLKGAYQKLASISRFMKEKLPIDTLINSCCYIDSKTDADTFFKQIDYLSVK